MVKRILLLLTVIITATAALNAQGFKRKGVALGVDRDTMLYIIASPFDNWYIVGGGGIQTFIGNELRAPARHNKLNFNGHVEIGKWIIPDIAISARLSIFNVDGQSQYPQNPFIDYTSVPTYNDPIHGRVYEYQPFHAHALSLMGFVTLDWTNFLLGYETGKRRRLHVFTPVGLGASMLFGRQVNPTNTEYSVGAFRRNFELSYSGGVGAEYELTQKVAVNLQAELFGSESTWDWSPYDNSYSRFDNIPSLSLGFKFNLLSNVTKYNPYTKRSTREKVNHEFLTFGTRNTVNSLKGRIERLNGRIDSIQNLSDQRGANDSLTLAAMNEELRNLQEQLDSARNNMGSPTNVLGELIQINEVLGLPAAIVYFQLDRYEIDYNGLKRLQNFAKEMNALDDTVEFYIVGAADSATGSIRHNQWLSERRCEATYNMLVNNFSVDGNQLIMVPVGGITEYDPQENNRMAMVILRTPTTEEIIERWTKKRNN